MYQCTTAIIQKNMHWLAPPPPVKKWIFLNKVPLDLSRIYHGTQTQLDPRYWMQNISRS